ncbi:MAG: hypothetical protein GC134_09195 [Proteobacteria bacterium]|nr:hypothetical protein [Pseudomonadota bacterium]
MNMFRVSTVAPLALALALAGCSSIENFLVPEGSSSSSAADLRTETVTSSAKRDLKDLNDAYVQNATGLLQNNISTQQDNFKGRVANYENIKTDITTSAQNYLNLISQLRAQLQVGTTPGNPAMIALLEKAADVRSTLTARVNDLQNFGNLVSKDITQVGFLTQTVGNAMALAGGTEGDRTVFQQMGLETKRLGQDYLILMQDVNLMIIHQRVMGTTLDSEYEELSTLVRQGLNSNPLAAQAFQLSALSNTAATAVPAQTSMPAAPAAVATPVAKSQPLAASSAAQPSTLEKLADKEILYVVSKSERKSGFEQELYDAVSKAYADDQNIKFHILGVAPIGANAAETNTLNTATSGEMEAFLKAMVDMGVPVSRVTLEVANSSKVDEPEVRLYKQ